MSDKYEENFGGRISIATGDHSTRSLVLGAGYFTGSNDMLTGAWLVSE